MNPKRPFCFFLVCLFVVFVFQNKVFSDDVLYELVEFSEEDFSSLISINEGGKGVNGRYSFTPLMGTEELIVSPANDPSGFDLFGELMGINNLGQIVGTRYARTGGPGAAGCNVSSFPVTIGLALPDAANGLTGLRDVNDSGSVVGACGGQCQHSFGRTSIACSFIDGVKEDIVFDVTDSLSDISTAVNNSNWVVGSASKVLVEGVRSRAFLKIPGLPIRDLGTFGGSESAAYDINDHGVVVGKADKVNGLGAFLYDTNGDAVLVDLGSLGGNSSVALGINTHGVVVGQSRTEENENRAFIYTSDGGMLDLNDLLERPLPSGVFLSAAIGINETGEIVGILEHEPNQYRSFLLRPIRKAAAARSDFTGDQVGDYAIWRPTEGSWYIRGADAQPVVQQWGLPGDIPVKIDLNGDGKIDYGVWRPQEGTWYLCPSEDNNRCENPLVRQFGLPGDVPVVGDFDGDGKDDIAVFRSFYQVPGVITIIGQWYIFNSSTQTMDSFQFGLPGDIPMAADFDGDGVTDLAVWRPENGTWYVRYHSSNSSGPSFVRQWGLPGDKPIAGDFDGDGVSDLVVWRPVNGTWYVCPSRKEFDCTQGVGVQFGLPGDIPLGATFDANNVLNYTVWRPLLGMWFTRNSLTGKSMVTQWGLPGDIPVRDFRN